MQYTVLRSIQTRRGSRIRKGGFRTFRRGGGVRTGISGADPNCCRALGKSTSKKKLQTAVGGVSDHPKKNLYPRLHTTYRSACYSYKEFSSLLIRHINSVPHIESLILADVFWFRQDTSLGSLGTVILDWSAV